MNYYIQNTKAGYMGNAIIFWAKGQNGYTADIQNSHVFSEEESKLICSNDPEKNKAWPCEYIDKNEGNQIVTDSQYLDNNQIKKF